MPRLCRPIAYIFCLMRLPFVETQVPLLCFLVEISYTLYYKVKDQNFDQLQEPRHNICLPVVCSLSNKPPHPSCVKLSYFEAPVSTLYHILHLIVCDILENCIFYPSKKDKFLFLTRL